jgi:hypothetical protein
MKIEKIGEEKQGVTQDAGRLKRVAEKVENQFLRAKAGVAVAVIVGA